MTTTVWELVDTALTTLNVSFAADKLLVASGSDYPVTYITYFLVSSPADEFADDEEQERSYKVQVNTFSKNGLISLPDVDGAMKAQGFIKGNVMQIPVDEETGHYGLGTEYVISI